ncbi:Catenin-beta-like protein [Lipomyces japonicus]|uniref:Catenin-beta-like protein n=1 Tax=Lipomyces japonicus TaxID=56871 RepID=UPI0034CE43EF
MDVDLIFKKPQLPLLKKRRGIETVSSSAKKYKSEVSFDNDSRQNDEPPESVEVEAEFEDDEEGGRFFGGGLTKKQQDVLDYVDSHANDGDTIDESWLKKQLSKLDKALIKNEQLRIKFADSPQKFMESEAELHEVIKSFSILTESSSLYTEFIQQNGLELLAKAMIHENMDIVIVAIQILGELTDGDASAEESDLRTLIKETFVSGVVEIVVNTLKRVDLVSKSDISDFDSYEDKEKGVYEILSFIENITGFSGFTDELVYDDSHRKDTGLVEWLLRRISIKEKPISQNKQYAAEILSIIFPQSEKAQDQVIIKNYSAELNGVAVVLQEVAQYRYNDPLVAETYDREFFHNIFNLLSEIVRCEEGRTKFLENEGIDLLILILQSAGKLGKAHAVTVLDYALSSGSARSASIDFVENNGLAVLFKMFMSAKIDIKQKSSSRVKTSVDGIFSIIASLFRNLPEDSNQKMKLIARFVEKKFEKTVKLLNLRALTSDRLRRLDDILNTKREDFLKANTVDDEKRANQLLAFETDCYFQRTDGGLFRIQLMDIIIAWLLAEDDDNDLGIKNTIEQNLGSSGLRDVHKVLNDYLTELKELVHSSTIAQTNTDNGEKEQNEASDLIEMISVLMEFVSTKSKKQDQED